MTKSIHDLPDDLLEDLFCHYVSVQDLARLQLTCRRFYTLLVERPSPWKKALKQRTNVSFSRLKNAIGCPSIENNACPSPRIDHPLYLPPENCYEVVVDNSAVLAPLLPVDGRSAHTRIKPCSTLNCDITRVLNNYRYLLPLSDRWSHRNSHASHTIVKFARRAQTSPLQYDEHRHHLWFSVDGVLQCLNLSTNQIDHSYAFEHDDVLCYKVYNEHLLAQANGNMLRVICRRTGDIHECHDNQNLSKYTGERNDILSLDVYSNDQERYLVANGSRDYSVSMRTFDLSSQETQMIWRTKVDDRVLCSRFTTNGQHLLVGTGGRAQPYPLVLFNTERARPLHVYDAQYRHGAGVRCIEWVSPDVFIAAGFDNQFKEFDLRTGSCHYTFDDRLGNDYFSMAVSAGYDNVSNGIILGCNRHSTVCLVNRTQRRLQKVFFVSDKASPVHSVAVTSEYLFASLDRSIVALDFTKGHSRWSSIRHRF